CSFLSSEMRFHIITAAFLWAAFVESRKIRGISSSYKRFYRERKSFLCIDGSKIIPFEQVNDDYCDCADGSDEPGTSACPRGRFYCTNLGFRPHYIPSSRVNDGICDCCDASDEYNSHARCQNTCWNLGQKERAYVEGQMKTLDEGLRLKQQLIEEGVLLWREKQAQLRELQRAAEDLQIKLEEHRKRKHEADRLKEQTLKALKAGDRGKAPSIFRTHFKTFAHFAELFQFTQLGRQANKLTILHLTHLKIARLCLCAASRSPLKIPPYIWRALFGNTRGAQSQQRRIVNLSDLLFCLAAEWEAADLKKVEEAYETVNMEISDLQKKLEIDYGTDWEYLFLNGQCYKLKVYEYMYTLCPFNTVSQKSTAGTEVSLGLWGMWAGPAKNRYSQMVYENGEPCWQGGSRTTSVTLTCGTETGLRSVKEPSKCQYIMDFETPVACQPVLKQRGVHSEL
uniref:Glucosidase 2 subunit beta n=1 Tax=Poecilia reticulata TaxID=8081 RepID=A0A3P9PTX2_POERE